MSNFEKELQEIFYLRETKGLETETLSKISELEPRILGEKDYISLCKLQWEKAFVYQHLLMSRVNSELNLKLMTEAALSAHLTVTDNKLTDLIGDDTRFLGRVYDYKQEYGVAYSYYQKALEFYQALNHPRVLEINAFNSANLINQGKTVKGLELAKKTYDNFDKSPLKQSDYYTWTVWKTGIYPRVLKALVDTNALFNKAELKQYLLSNQTMLKQSDKNFQFRLDEINDALNLIDK